jgi:multidrug resistance efflux pump
MPAEIDPQQFGELRATVAQLERTMEELNSTVKGLTAQLDQARGGWKVLVAVASAGAAAATAFSWIVDHVSLRP